MKSQCQCECGCGRFAKVGNRFIHGHSSRVPFGRGVTHSNLPGRVYSNLDLGKDIGTIVQKNPYDTFISKEDAVSWWQAKKTFFMDGVLKEYASSDRWAGDRPSIFWELEFGMFFRLTLEDQFFLLLSHSLFYPGEKEKAAGDLYEAGYTTIPESKFKSCLIHPCGNPIQWPEEGAVRLHGGRLQRADCISSKMIYQKKLESKNSRR